jgi:hypothetical protein
LVVEEALLVDGLGCLVLLLRDELFWASSRESLACSRAIRACS